MYASRTSGPYKDWFCFYIKTWLISDLQTSFLLYITILKVIYFIEEISRSATLYATLYDENMF